MTVWESYSGCNCVHRCRRPGCTTGRVLGVVMEFDRVWSKDGRIIFLDPPDEFGWMKIAYPVLAELLREAGWQPDDLEPKPLA